MNIREQILNAEDRELEPIDLPKWGSPEVFVRVMSGTERDDFEASMIQQRGKNVTQNLTNIRAKLAVRCLVDKEGKRVFSDDDAVELGKKSCSMLQLVFEKARDLNKLSNEDVEELAKN